MRGLGQIEDYVTAKQAAEQIGISYELLMARTRKGKIPFKKKGWAVLIHKSDVEKAIAEQKQRESRDADNQGMEEPTR